jgi:hypothetical protein
MICVRCGRTLVNRETYPWCVKCAFCKKRKHVLQVLPDGTLPQNCYLCDPKRYLGEVSVFLRNVKVKKTTSEEEKRECAQKMDGWMDGW